MKNRIKGLVLGAPKFAVPLSVCNKLIGDPYRFVCLFVLLGAFVDPTLLSRFGS